MPQRTLPGLGLTGFWDLGSDSWKDENDANLRTLSALVQARAISRTTPLPGSPANGDIYIVPADAAEHPNEIAIRDDGAWVYIAPAEGFAIYVADANENVQFDGAAWVPFASGGGGIEDAPANGTLYGRKDGAWAAVPTGGGGGASIEFIGEIGSSYQTLDFANTTPINAAGFVASPGSVVTYPDASIGTTEAYRFADIGPNEKTGFVWQVDIAEATTLEVRAANSSEIGFDYMIVEIDGVEAFHTRNQSVGNIIAYSAPLSVGSHTIRAYYRKDGSGDSADDTVYITRFRYFAPQAGAYQPGMIGTYQGDTYICVAETDAGPPSGAWVLIEREAPSMELSLFAGGTLAANELLFRYEATRAFTIPAAMAGSRGSSGAAATGAAALSVKKNGAQVGTATWSSGTAATLAMASATSFAVGDVLTVTAPATPDASLADVSLTIAATLN